MVRTKNHGRIAESVGDVVLFLLVCAFYIIRSVFRYLTPSAYRNKRSLYGEVVLITGGGGGLGRLLALRFARLGATLVLWDVNTSGMSGESAANGMKIPEPVIAT